MEQIPSQNHLGLSSVPLPVIHRPSLTIIPSTIRKNLWNVLTWQARVFTNTKAKQAIRQQSAHSAISSVLLAAANLTPPPVNLGNECLDLPRLLFCGNKSSCARFHIGTCYSRQPASVFPGHGHPYLARDEWSL